MTDGFEFDESNTLCVTVNLDEHSPRYAVVRVDSQKRAPKPKQDKNNAHSTLSLRNLSVSACVARASLQSGHVPTLVSKRPAMLVSARPHFC